MLISDDILLRKYINNLIYEGVTPQNSSISFVDNNFIIPIYNKICKEILPIVLSELYNIYPNASSFIFKSFGNKVIVDKDKLLNALSDPVLISSIHSKLPDLTNVIDINQMLTSDNIKFIKLINNTRLKSFNIFKSDEPFKFNLFFANNEFGIWPDTYKNRNISIPKDMYSGFFQLLGYKNFGLDCLITFNLFHLVYHSFLLYDLGVIKNNKTWDDIFNNYIQDFIKIELLKVIRHELEHAFQIINNLFNRIKMRVFNYINSNIKTIRNKERKRRIKDRLIGKVTAIPNKLDVYSFLSDINTDQFVLLHTFSIIFKILKESPVIATTYGFKRKRKGYGFTKTNPNILKYSNQNYVNQNNNSIKGRESRLYRYDPVEIIPQLNDLVMGYVFAAAGIFANAESAIDWFFEFIDSNLFKEKYAFEKDFKIKSDILELFLKNSNSLNNKDFVIDDVLINNKLPYKSFNFTEDFNNIIEEFINNFNYILLGESDLLFDLLSVKQAERSKFFDESNPTTTINRSNSIIKDADILNDPNTKSISISDINSYRDKLGKEIKNLFIKKVKKLWNQQDMLNINLDI